VRIGEEKVVKRLSPCSIVEVGGQLREHGKVEHPFPVAGERAELIGCELVELDASGIGASELVVDQGSEAAERAVARAEALALHSECEVAVAS
jgi:hypothetical protein